MRPGITAVIPAHTPRLVDGSLRRAVDSVAGQDRPVEAISIAVDATGQGAAATRQRALDAVATEWVAFLDADDIWYPHHLSTLTAVQEATGADYVYSWFDGNSPFPGHRGRQMDPAAPHHTTITVLCRTGLAQEVGFQPHPEATAEWSAEDWLFTLRCLERGARFAGTGEITWHYGVDGANTSGLASRWTPHLPPADVTVVIPHIGPRRAELARAVESVTVQTVAPAAISIAVDTGREGSAATRNRALAAAGTGWVAFLDDDDAWEINHLGLLTSAAAATPDADVLYSGCTVVDADGSILPPREEWGRFGEPFDAAALRARSWLPVTCLARTGLARAAGFHRPPGSPYDDWGFHLAMLDAGARYVHVPVRTWVWHHHGRNTSGLPSRW